jgi:ATP-dependent RNA helicase DeaD
MSDATAEPVATAFAALGLDARLVETLGALGYEEPTPIQRAAIPVLLEGKDLVGQAATGTGKTAAFALPLLQRLDAAGRDRARPWALVLVPTRELAMQVAQAVHRYGRGLGASVVAIYGGQAYARQIHALERGTDVVVATPGRALDLVRRGDLRLDGVAGVVLDEADEMLDMGFAEDIEALLAQTPKQRQTMLFSATMPPRIASIARRHLTAPAEIRIARDPVAAGTVPKVRQTAYLVPRAHKLAALGRVLDVEAPASALVFCRTRTEVDELAEALGSRGYRPEALHGGMSQEQRNRVMRLFRSGAADLLVATDVAARGLDIERLSHVVNYHVPPEAESYIHRIGRVGRAGREGVAITLADPREHRMLRNIEKITRQKIELSHVPTVADLRARRLELTRAALRDAILDGDLEHYRVVVESLAGEFDVMDIALASVKLAHRATAGPEDDQAEIPAPRPEPERPRERPGRGRGGALAPPAGPRGRGRAADGRPTARGRGPVGAGPGAGAGMARIYVGVGREAGVSPRDLVGAITGEAGLSGRQIGAIDIADRFALVEVPEELARQVVDALRATRIKGRKATVRRDRRGTEGR